MPNITESTATINSQNIIHFPDPEINGMSFPTQKSVPVQITHDIIKSEKQTEESIMPQETYTKSEIDLKFDKISSDVENRFEKIDLKFEMLMQKMDDNFEKQRLNTEKMFSDFKLDLLTEQKKDKKEFTFWLIGLLISSIIGISAIIVTILTAK